MNIFQRIQEAWDKIPQGGNIKYLEDTSKKKTVVRPWSDIQEGGVTYSPVEGNVPPPWRETDYLESAVGWVYTCVSVISEEVASIKLHLYKRSKGKVEDITEDDESGILDSLYRVNSFTTKFDHFQLTQQYLDTAGEAPWLIEFEKQREGDKISSIPKSIYLLRPDKLTVNLGKKAEDRVIQGYTYEPEPGNKIKFSPESIIFLKYPNPVAQFRGKGTVEAAERVIELDRYAEEWNRNFFFNAARPDALLTTEEKLTDDQKAQLKKTWDISFRGLNKHAKVALLEGGLKYTQMQLSQKDMDFLEQQKFSMAKIFSIFGVPKAIASVSDDVNRANAETAAYTFARWTIKPKMRRIVEQLNEFFIPLFNSPDDLFLDFEDPVPENITQKNETYTKALSPLSGWMTINEVRTELGLPEVEDGDIVLRNMGVAPIGLSESELEEEKPEEEKPEEEKPEEEKPEKEKPKKGKVIQFKVKGKRIPKDLFGEQRKSLNAKRDKKVEKINEAVKKLVKAELTKKKLINNKKEEVNKKKSVDNKFQEREVSEIEYGIKDNISFWYKQIEIEEQAEKELIVVLKKYFKRQEMIVLSKVSNKSMDTRIRAASDSSRDDYSLYWELMIKGVDDMLLDASDEAGKLAKIVEPIEDDLILKVGDYTLSEMGSSVEFIGSDNVTAFLKKEPLKLGKEVNAVTNNRLRKTLSEGLASKESVVELSKRVKGVFNSASTYRALSIARTESSRATNFATVEAYKQSGVVKGKEWLTAFDERTCPFCSDMDGRIIELDDNFFDKGESLGELSLDYGNVGYPPLHPSCRCTTIPFLKEIPHSIEVSGIEKTDFTKEARKEFERTLEELKREGNKISKINFVKFSEEGLARVVNVKGKDIIELNTNIFKGDLSKLKSILKGARKRQWINQYTIKDILRHEEGHIIFTPRRVDNLMVDADFVKNIKKYVGVKNFDESKWLKYQSDAFTKRVEKDMSRYATSTANEFFAESYLYARNGTLKGKAEKFGQYLLSLK